MILGDRNAMSCQATPGRCHARSILPVGDTVRIGAVFPTLELTDPRAAWDYAQAAEDLGYARLSVPRTASASTPS
jgi:hypothetical protein